MGQPHERTGAPDTGASSRRHQRGRRRADTRDPRRSRERALKILFQADIRGEGADTLLARIVDDPRAWVLLDELDPEAAADELPEDGLEALEAGDAVAAKRRKQLELDGFTRSLVLGVADHQQELDELIQRFARRWTVSRMPAIDRNLLRLGSYELAHEVTSSAVVINEVIELAKRLSTEDSGRYVNGVLEAVRKHLAAQPRERSAPDAELEPVVPDTTEAPPFEPVAAEPSDPEPPAADATDPIDPIDPLIAEELDAELLDPGAPEPVDVDLTDPVDVDRTEPVDVDITDPAGPDVLDAEPLSDVLPPPDDDGDAVDLVTEPTPDEPDDEPSADDPDAEVLGDEVLGDDDVEASPGAGQQQLF